MTTTLARSHYKTLLARVRKALFEGRLRAKTALEREEVRTWWEAARIVNRDLRNHRGRARYGEEVVLKLAGDLGVSKDYLYDILRFQRAFPIVDSSQQLTLSHYRVLARIENPEERRRLHRKAVREKLSTLQLLDKIRSRRLLAPEDLKLEDVKGVRPRRVRPLVPRRGRFFTYRVTRPRNLHADRGFHSLDLGFGNRHDLLLTGLRSPRSGEIIEAIRTKKDPRGDRYRFKRVGSGLRRPQDLLYTYQAFVTDVIDDDTLWADIDLGFRFKHERKLRFRGIDAAEIEKGKKASDYVKRILARVPFVVITITGRDKFGRPLTDLFYLEGTQDREKVLREGKYLNQELLDLGLARRMNA